MQHRLKTKHRFAYAEDIVSQVTENINILVSLFFKKWQQEKEKVYSKYKTIHFLFIYKKGKINSDYTHNFIT